ncbi:MAG: ATP:cob(I)alamin adenosyltransferase [Planctomycetota bacterium]
MARISTGLGDDGTTQRPGGGRVPKSDLMLDCVGDWDELGCLLGVVATYDLPPTVRQPLESIRQHLFHLSASFYTPNRDMDAGLLAELNANVDSLETTLPPLRSFILPGGSIAAAQLHFARAVCRRAERSMTRLLETERRGGNGAAPVSCHSRESGNPSGSPDCLQSGSRSDKRSSCHTRESGGDGAAPVSCHSRESGNPDTNETKMDSRFRGSDNDNGLKRPISLAYANRLSVWLFLAARAVNAAANIPDTTIQLTSTETSNENRE